MTRGGYTTQSTRQRRTRLSPIPLPLQADKRFQLADWRVRPLTPEMLHYARCDTHYLLYCYDRLRVGAPSSPCLAILA